METGKVEEGGKNLSSNEELMAFIKKQSEVINSLKSDIETLKKTDSSMHIGALAEAISSINKKQAEINYEDGVAEEQIPEDDFLKEGVRFCAPFVGYVIVDDKRKGLIVKLPYNKKSIVFDYGATRKTQTGKYNNTHSYSVYVSKSKKEIEWLRNHSLYNITFYETSTEAVQNDAIRSMRLANIMSYIKEYELPDLMSVAKDYGVAISEDSAVLRSKLAFAIFEKEVAAENEQTRKILEENHVKEVLSLGKK